MKHLGPLTTDVALVLLTGETSEPCGNPSQGKEFANPLVRHGGTPDQPDSICSAAGTPATPASKVATTPTAVTYDEDETQAHVNGGEMSLDDEALVCEIHEG